MNVEIAKNDISTIYISGRVDSGNVGEFEASIMEVVEANPDNLYTIDAKNLSYISSAGLRFFLKLKKRKINLQIINVTSAVYDVFFVTGFTKILDVKKACRELSVEGCTVLGQGANGIVYRLDSETILKLYTKTDCMDEIREEREHAEAALVAGIPTAISFDIVKSGDRYGTVFELLDAKSLVEVINEHPEDISQETKEFVELLKEVHEIPKSEMGAIELPSAKDRFISWVEGLKDHLESEVWESLRAKAEQMPEANWVLHGDCQPNNVMATEDGYLFIDMDTLSYGDPVFELGYLYSTVLGYRAVNPEDSLSKMSEATARDFWKLVFGQYYSDKSPEERKELECICRIVSAVQVYRNMIKNVDRRGMEAVERAKNVLEKVVRA